MPTALVPVLKLTKTQEKYFILALTYKASFTTLSKQFNTTIYDAVKLAVSIVNRRKQTLLRKRVNCKKTLPIKERKD